MNYLGEMASYYSGYKMCNKSNLYNFLLMTMNKQTDDERKLFISDMKMIMGNSFTYEFSEYIFRKLPSSDLLNYFKN